MIYLQHTDPVVCVPQHISRYGLYTSQFFLLNALCNYIYGYQILTIIGVTLYITSLLHWYKIQSFGLIKTLDIIACIITINYTTFNDSLYFCPRNRQLWILSTFVSIIAYLTNKYICSYQLFPEGTDYFAANEPYQYFSLKYTWPNTLQRELSYKYSTYVHIILIHINLSCVCIYGVVTSPSCSNYYISN
jgi:hypothetical protein